MPMLPSILSHGQRRLPRKFFDQIERAINHRQPEAPVAQADETSWPMQFIVGYETGRDPPTPTGLGPTLAFQRWGREGTKSCRSGGLRHLRQWGGRNPQQ